MEKQFRTGQTMVLEQGWKANCYRNCGKDKYDRLTDEKKNDLIDKITKYKDYTSEQKDMARKSFKCVSVDYYDDTGRIKYMEFVEK